MRPQVPCMGCDERSAEPNCHTECRKYLLFEWLIAKEKHEAEKDKYLDELHDKLGYRRHKMGGLDMRRRNETQREYRRKR